MAFSPWIHAPAPRRPRESRQRRQPHARVPAFAALDSTGTGAAAKMQSNDVECIRILAQELGNGASDEGIADTMEAVLAQAVLAGNLLVNRVGGNMARNGCMELRVEAGDISSTRQLLHTRVHNRQRSAIVQWCQLAQLFEAMVSLLGDGFGLFVVSPVDDPMASNGHVLGGADLMKLVVINERF